MKCCRDIIIHKFCEHIVVVVVIDDDDDDDDDETQRFNYIV